jgi:hypothetical protein
MISAPNSPIVPDVEGRQGAGLRPGRTRRLQQGVPLPERPVVVGQDALHPRGDLDQEFVDHPATPGRLTADECQVLRSEEHAGAVARQLARLDRRAVHLRPVRPGAVDLHLGEDAAVLVREPSADDRRVAPLSHECGVRRDPVRAERGQVADGLDQVGLALTVAADEQVRPACEVDVRLPVVPEVGELEMVDVHAGRDESRG